MALRDVKPFDSQQMARLNELMERGATIKQVENFEKAQEHVAKAKVNRNF